MQRLVMATCTVALFVACGGQSDGDAAKHQGNAGQAAQSSAGTDGRAGAAGLAAAAGGGAGKSSGGASSAGAANAGGTGNHAGAGAAGGGAGRSTAGLGGTSGTSGTSAGATSGHGGEAGRGGAGAGNGDAGDSGAGQSGGKPCGGLAGSQCAVGEYCDYLDCRLPDAGGECRSTEGESCETGRVCGCDGNVYESNCRAHSEGVDTTQTTTCTRGSGAAGDPCFVDDDCGSGQKCCSSPIGLVTCTSAPSGSCPLTP